MINATKEQQSAMRTLLEATSINFPRVGDIIEGIVIAVGNNEVLIDLDGIACGLVRGREIVDVSGSFSNVKVGDRVRATVLDLENEQGNLELSFRAAGQRLAWERLRDLQRMKTTIDVDIVEANKGGLIVRLGNLPGFLPVSQLAPEHYPRVEGGDKQKILERLKTLINQKFTVRIIDVDEANEKLIVSERAMHEEQQRAIIDKYKAGDIVEGTVSGVVDFGAFVEFDEGLEGLVHISEIAWQRVEDPRRELKVGDRVRAKIIHINQNRISLSLKALKENPWDRAAERYRIGSKVKGRVVKMNPFGLFVELDPDIQGLAHISELNLAPGQHMESIAHIGDEKEFSIISLEPQSHRLGLSLRAPAEAPTEQPAPPPPSEEPVPSLS